MKCPICDETMNFRMFFYSRKPGCLFCQNRLYLGIKPVMLIIGLIIGAIGLDSFSGVLLKSSFLLIAYVFVVGLAVCISAIRIMPKPGILDLMPNNVIYQAYFLSSTMLILIVVALITIIYYFIIPSKQNLSHIEATFIRLEKNDNTLIYILLDKGTPKKFYVVTNKDLVKKCPGIEQVEPYSNMKLLTDNSPCFGGYYTRIWEMTVNTEVVIPYEIMRNNMIEYRKNEMLDVLKLAVGILLFYLITLYFKRKVDQGLEIRLDFNVSGPNETGAFKKDKH